MSEFWRSAELPHLEARRSCQENSCYRPHTHDAFSVGLIDAGASVLAGHLGGVIGLRPGDVVLIPAGQVHDCNPDDGVWRYQMIHMDQEWAATLAPRSASSGLFSGISVIRRPDLHRRVSVWSESIFADAPAERIEAEFRALSRELDAAAPEHRVPGGADPELFARLASVMHRLRHDDSNPALSELAELVGMTKYQLVRAMKRATGLAPLAWRQNARVATARRMLRDGQPIAETAHALGFTDQSHFHRVFRAHVATSPGAYRG
ncbi:helix-turn-helix transcriptional regulator [Isoptericola croceus]|uniref:helix-turn-helix transcriptional regulator n=1 Tax=Isoptericola croceus TaxID=3031406 RepID=UPI0023F64470|nr:AraC family transcriptional regulator [Isoptericola croceus]